MGDPLDLSIIESNDRLFNDVSRLEEELLKMPQASIETVHIFKPGVYERKIIIPPWTVLTGAAHKTDYSVRIERGSIAVNADDGIKILSAPCEFGAKAGVRRVGRVLSDEVIWVDIYENKENSTNIDDIESRLYEIPECGLGENRIAEKIKLDRNDFELFLQQYGISQELISNIVNIESDLIDMPSGFNVELRKSKIHGVGMFALKEFLADEVICPGRISGNRTPGGRFINHSQSPNARPQKSGDDIFAVAIRRIQENEEIVIDYRDSMLINFGVNIKGESPCLDG